jgi:hypothetical protein
MPSTLSWRVSMLTVLGITYISSVIVLLAD